MIWLPRSSAASPPVRRASHRTRRPGYTQAAFILLGRVAGLAETAIGMARARGDREAVIARALGSRP